MELAAETIMDSVYRFANILALPGIMELRSSPYFVPGNNCISSDYSICGVGSFWNLLFENNLGYISGNP